MASRRAGLLVLLVGSMLSRSAGGQGLFEPPPDSVRSRLRAVRLTGELHLDGRLDEIAWRSAPEATGFRQIEPRQGEPAVFLTSVRVLFDERHVYLGAFMWDTASSRGVRVPDLRRDFATDDRDLFGVQFDPLRDGRAAIAFVTNPYGAQRDLQSLDDQGRLLDLDWDTPWTVRTTLSDSGWTAEMAIPWSALRYRTSKPGERERDATAAQGTSQPRAGAVDAEGISWGVNFIRIARRANEVSGWSPWPRAYSVLRMRYAGLLTGLEPPPPSTNLRFQPYVVLRGDRRVFPATAITPGRVEQTGEPAIGGDAKWAITPNTVLDATIHTDFAQADADVQQINLSRFSLFFPEKRQFFLENAGLLTLGLGSWGEPFFSRRVGLDAAGRPVAIDGGLRLTHRTAGQSVAALAIRQRGSDSVLASTFGIARYIHNTGSEDRVGAMVVSRLDERAGRAIFNTVGAVDAFVRPTRASYARAALARSWQSGAGGEGTAAWIHAAAQTNRGYFGWIQTYYGEDYRPDAGFLPRPDLILTSPAVTLDLRPSWRPRWVRSFNPAFTTAFYHRASDGVFQEGSIWVYPVTTTLQNGAYVRPWIHPQWQRLDRPFLLVPGLTIPPGNYAFTDFGVTYRDDLSRQVWWWVTVGSGPYFDGRKDYIIYRMRISPDPRAALTIDYEGNRMTDIGPDDGRATTHLWYPELRLALNPRLQLVGLWQYNSISRMSSRNVRFTWEFRPLSYLYVVYNDRGYQSRAGESSTGVPATERQLVVKLNWLWQP